MWPNDLSVLVLHRVLSEYVYSTRSDTNTFPSGTVWILNGNNGVFSYNIHECWIKIPFSNISSRMKFVVWDNASDLEISNVIQGRLTDIIRLNHIKSRDDRQIKKIRMHPSTNSFCRHGSHFQRWDQAFMECKQLLQSMPRPPCPSIK